MLRLIPLLSVCLCLLMSGCLGGGGIPQTTYRTKIAGGQTVDLPMDPATGPVQATDGNFTVQLARFKPEPPKQIIYEFSLSVKDGLAPRHITVEEVSEDVPSLLVDDASPKLGQNVWHAFSEPIPSGDPRIKWVMYVDNTLLIYRFTITTDAGRTVILLQPVPCPGQIKMLLRATFGDHY